MLKYKKSIFLLAIAIIAAFLIFWLFFEPLDKKLVINGDTYIYDRVLISQEKNAYEFNFTKIEKSELRRRLLNIIASAHPREKGPLPVGARRVEVLILSRDSELSFTFFPQDFFVFINSANEEVIQFYLPSGSFKELLGLLLELLPSHEVITEGYD